MIHETAIIDPSAKLADNVTVGPWSIIGPDVEIGEGTWIGSHVVIKGPTRIGCDNQFFQFTSIGEIPQDKKFEGENSRLEIGDRNRFREFCTVQRGTLLGGGLTKIGDDNLFMNYVHVAHDCIIANHCTFSNNASLAGHVVIEDFVGLGGFSGVHQFCRVGEHSFSAASTIIVKDVPPFLKVMGYFAKPFGLNTVGLQRRGYTSDTLQSLKRAYKIIYRQGLVVEQAIEALQELIPECPEVQKLIDFIQKSERGIVR